MGNTGFSATPLLLKFSAKLYPDPQAQAQFLEALLNPQPYPATILWCQPRPQNLPFECLPPLAWQPEWVDRLAVGIRPGQYSLHDQGAYYVLDASSVFAALPLVQVAAQISPGLVIDVCAAPGGKSIFAWRALNPTQLIANEVIGKRLGMLHANLKRCRITSAELSHREVPGLVAQYRQQADVVIVDAPCSGQSLLAKGTAVPGCFHPQTIRHNAQRQKKIIAQASELVKPGGFLLYSTCTFAIDENEAVMHWFGRRWPQFQAQSVPLLQGYASAWAVGKLKSPSKKQRYAQSDATEPMPRLPCYRLGPESGIGAGAFTCLWQHQGDGVSDQS